jgi:hypothetical protein
MDRFQLGQELRGDDIYAVVVRMPTESQPHKPPFGYATEFIDVSKVESGVAIQKLARNTQIVELFGPVNESGRRIISETVGRFSAALQQVEVKDDYDPCGVDFSLKVDFHLVGKLRHLLEYNGALSQRT